MIATDDTNLYKPTLFFENLQRLNEKYGRAHQPQYSEILQKRREDEIRWNERYAFTKGNRSILFINDLRSYFMDFDTKRKYQVHDNVPINPVCRTGIAGRGYLPFWGPNHTVIVLLLRYRANSISLFYFSIGIRSRSEILTTPKLFSCDTTKARSFYLK